MGIKVKAIERNVAFEKGKQKWAFVMQADLYSQLNASKVIEEAAIRSGLPKAVINAGWTAIGDVIAAWATEGHSVAVPGLGSLRFGLNSTAVEDVNKVSANLITRRYIIFVPNTEIKKELEETSVSITCYDRNGKVVKQVTSTDKPSATTTLAVAVLTEPEAIPKAVAETPKAVVEIPKAVAEIPKAVAPIAET